MGELIYQKEYKKLQNCSIAIIGLGYVGLPLAITFGKTKSCSFTKKKLNRKIIGYDINESRINQLNDFRDKTNEIDEKDFIASKSNLIFTNDKNDIIEADIFIITVPTPITSSKDPDLFFIESATSLVGEAINRKYIKDSSLDFNPLIIYESTVYPGVTEDICVPILEKITGKKLNQDFFVGYSPERINPGDKKNTLNTIIKVTSGSNREASLRVDYLYKSIIDAGTFNVSSIKIAEACKVIENTQRDLNIAFVNELSMIFKALEIPTLEVLEAAKTKWNFLDFKPGLVGGHCIGIDPYYLTYKSRQMGISPRLVSSGRKINDGMAKWIVDQLIIEMARKKLVIGGEKVLILGYSYKENCGDHRNSRVVDIVRSLNVYGLICDVVDPYIDSEECEKDYSLKILNKIPSYKYGAVVVAVGHDIFRAITYQGWIKIIKNDGIIFDVKGICPENLPVIKI
tara:strand:+ start:225 stop:1595 length:1371 start_codon:yes stop_codon:yes gene_type:complete